MRGTSAPYSRTHRHAVAQLVPEHDQRALEALGHVDAAASTRGPAASRTARRATSSEMRRVDSFTSASSVATESVLATHSRPGSRAGPSRTAAARVAPGEIDAGGGQRRGDGPFALDAVAGQPDARAPAPGRRGPAGPGQPPSEARSRGAARRGRRTARPRARRGPAGRAEESSVCARGLEGVDRPGGGGGRVVDLVREAGGERAEGDQRLALPGRRLDGARGAVEALDEVPAEREPGAGPLAQHLGRHPEHPTGGHAPAGREIDAVLVPGAEPAGPAARARPSWRPRCPRGRRGG